MTFTPRSPAGGHGRGECPAPPPVCRFRARKVSFSYFEDLKPLEKSFSSESCTRPLPPRHPSDHYFVRPELRSRWRFTGTLPLRCFDSPARIFKTSSGISAFGGMVPERAATARTSGLPRGRSGRPAAAVIFGDALTPGAHPPTRPQTLGSALSGPSLHPTPTRIEPGSVSLCLLPVILHLRHRLWSRFSRV